MSRVGTLVFVVSCLFLIPLARMAQARPNGLAAQNNVPTDADKPALDADHAFQEAVSKGDITVLGNLLDTDFTWTNADGKTLSRAQVLQTIPKLLIDYPGYQAPVGSRTPVALVNSRNYGDLEAFQEFQGKDNILRIWAKRPAGWRLLVYQETRLMDAAPAATVGTSEACENPCKTVPYTPKNASERDILAAYMALQTATVLHDSTTWGKYVADEFRAANSNSNQVLDKPGRMADLERSKMAGYSPMPVVSLRLFDFGNAAVLISQHQPEHGKPVHITRLWIKRNSQWQEAASYQTRIEAAPARP